MSADTDDDALAWAGDSDPSLIAPSKPVTAGPPEGAVKKSVPSVLLISYGILGGIYLIYTVGWVITVTRSTTTLPNLFGEIMFQFGEFLAIGSPAIWFAAVFLLTRGRKPVLRLLGLLLGLIVVIPWPFVLGV